MTPVIVSRSRQLVGVPFADSVRNLFPDAQEIDLSVGKTLLIPHQPTESFMLRKLGFDVPSPILTHYEWPGNVVPFLAQRQTSALLTMSSRAYVLNDKGTGKTKAALWAWDYLRGNNLADKVFIVAPLSTLKFTWAREVFNTLPHRKCVVLHGTREKRIKLLADTEAEIFIINHDGIKVIGEELAKRTDIDSLIIDELAVYRNGGAARTKALKAIAAKLKWVWGMTGAPIPTSPTDVWAQASIVTPNTVPKFFGRFRDDLMLKVAQFKYLPKPDATDRAYAVLQPAVRFKLDDVQELPTFVEQFVDVEMGPVQAKIYKELAKDCYSMVQKQEITAANAGAVMMKLLQVATGWVYARDGAVVPLDNNKRIEALIDAVNSTDRKVLVFSPFKHCLAGISSALTAEGIEHAEVSGDTPAEERARVFNLFQNTEKYRVINAHPQCLAHGITLTAAATVVWFAPTTSLEIYDQANARIRRVGQTHKQLYLHLQSTPVEKRIYSMLQRKQAVQTQLLELFEIATETNPER